MMGLVLKLLGGTAGPWIAGGLAATLMLSAGSCSVQSARLKHAKADLVATRAQLKDPQTGRTWKSEAEASAADFATCKANTGELEGKIRSGNAALAAAKAEGDRRAEMLASALQGARQAAHDADKRAGELLAFKPKGADVCARLEAVDAEVVRSAK